MNNQKMLLMSVLFAALMLITVATRLYLIVKLAPVLILLGWLALFIWWLLTPQRKESHHAD